MPGFIVITILIVVTILIVKSIYDAQQHPDRPERHRSSEPARKRPRPGRDRSPRSSPAASAPIDEAALADHVTKLREAVGQELISTDEAVASVVRFTDGALSDEAARELIRRKDAA